MVSIRAIYHDGQLRLLDPINLREGQEIQIHIVEQPDSLTQALADMLILIGESESALTGYDESAAQQRLDAALSGQRPLSEIILEERHERE